MNIVRTYTNLSEVQARKEELKEEIHKANTEIGGLWTTLFTPKKVNSKGELIATIISSSITAFDAFLLVRKLMNQYGNLFGRKKKRR